MIDLAQPSMALNDERLHSAANMQYGMAIAPKDRAEEIIEWIAEVGRMSGKLRNVVFSCHGAPGYMQMGTGFDINNVSLFSRLRGRVEKIWLRGCETALAPGNAPGARGDGNAFCSRMAREACCDVVAATEVQVSKVGRLPFGKLDTFEGLVLNYGPAGTVTWSQRYKSGYFKAPRAWGMVRGGWQGNDG